MDFKKGFQMPSADKAGGKLVNTSTDKRDNSGGLLTDMAEASSTRDHLSMRIDPKEYEKYGVAVNALDMQNPESNLDRQRAENQSVLEQFGGSLARAVAGELIGGTISGFGALLDIVDGKAFGDDNDYTNVLTDIGDGIRDWTESKTPIYEKNPDGGIHLGDTGYLFSRLPSVVSSISLLVPARFATAGVAKAASLVGKAAKASRVAMSTVKGINTAEHIARTANIARGVSEISKYGKFIGYVEKAAESGRYGKIGTKIANKALKVLEPKALAALGNDALASVVMRYGENYQESRQLYNETKGATTEFLADMSNTEYSKWVSEHKSELGDDIDYEDREAVADKLAKKSADRTFSLNAANVVFDFIQLRALGKAFTGVASSAVSWEARQAQKLATRTLGKSVEESAEIAVKFTKTGIAKQLSKRSYQFGKTALAEWTESIEEGINNIATQEGQLYAKQLRGELDDESTPDILSRAEQYLKDPTLHDSALWGLLGGIAFQGLGTVYNKAENRLKYGKDYVPYAEHEKNRMAEINDRKTEFEAAQRTIESINRGFIPNTYEKNEDGTPVIDEDGKFVPAKFKNDEELQLAKDKVKNDVISRMTLNAIKVGNYDMLKSYMEDKNVRQRMIDAGIDTPTNYDNHNRESLAIMNKTYNSFVKYASLLRRANVSDAYLNVAITNNIINEHEVESIQKNIDLLAQRNNDIANDNESITTARTNHNIDEKFKIGLLQNNIVELQKEIAANPDNRILIENNTRMLKASKTLLNEYMTKQTPIAVLKLEQQFNDMIGNPDNLSNEELDYRDFELSNKLKALETEAYSEYADKIQQDRLPFTENGEIDTDKFDSFMDRLNKKLEKNGRFNHIKAKDRPAYLEFIKQRVIEKKSLTGAYVGDDYLDIVPKDAVNPFDDITDVNEIAKFASDVNQEYVDNLAYSVWHEISKMSHTSDIINDQSTAKAREKEFNNTRIAELERIKARANNTIIALYKSKNFEAIHKYIKTGDKTGLSKEEIAKADEVKAANEHFHLERAIEDEYKIAKENVTSPVGTRTTAPVAATEPATEPEAPAQTPIEETEEEPATAPDELAPALTEEELLAQYESSAPNPTEEAPIPTEEGYPAAAAESSNTFSKGFTESAKDVKDMTAVEYGQSIGATPEEIAIGLSKSYLPSDYNNTVGASILRETGATFSDMDIATPLMGLNKHRDSFNGDDRQSFDKDGKVIKTYRAKVISDIYLFAQNIKLGLSNEKATQTVTPAVTEAKPESKPVPKAKAKVSAETTVNVEAKKEMDSVMDQLLGAKREYTIEDLQTTKFTMPEPIFLGKSIYPYTSFVLVMNNYGMGVIEFSTDRADQRVDTDTFNKLVQEGKYRDDQRVDIDIDTFNKLVQEGKIIPTGDETESAVKESAIDEAFNRGKAIADIITTYVKATGKIKRNGRIDISIEDMMRYLRDNYGKNVADLYDEIKTTAYYMQDMSTIIRIIDSKRVTRLNQSDMMNLVSKPKEVLIKEEIDSIPDINAQIDTTNLPANRTLISKEEEDNYNAVMRLAPETVVTAIVNENAIEIHNGETQIGILPVVAIQADGSYRKTNEHWNYVVNSHSSVSGAYVSDFISDLHDVLNIDTNAKRDLIDKFENLRRDLNFNENVDESLAELENDPIYKELVSKYSTDITDRALKLKRAGHILKLFGYKSNINLSQSGLLSILQESLQTWVNKLGSTYSYINSIKRAVESGNHDVVISNTTSGRLVKLPNKDGKQTYMSISDAIHKEESSTFELYFPFSKDGKQVLYKDGDPHTDHNANADAHYQSGGLVVFVTDAAGRKVPVHTFPNSIQGGAVKTSDAVRPIHYFISAQIDTLATSWLGKDDTTFAKTVDLINEFAGNKMLLYGLKINSYPNGGRSVTFTDNATKEVYTIFFNSINNRRNIKIQVNNADVLNNKGKSVVFMDYDETSTSSVPVSQSVTNLRKYTKAHMSKVRINFSLNSIVNNGAPNKRTNERYGNNEKGEFAITIPSYQTGQITVDEETLTFPSYKDFLIDNNLIITDTAPVTNAEGKVIGNFIAASENDGFSIGYDKNFSIGLRPKASAPITNEQNEDQVEPDSSNLSDATKAAINKSLFEHRNSLSAIANILNVHDYDAVLTLLDTLGVRLPDSIVARKRRANESPNKVVYADMNTATGEMRIYEDWYNLDNEQKVRKLIHEALHFYLSKLSSSRNGVVREEFNQLYIAYRKYINSGAVSKELAANMRKYLNANKSKSVQIEEFIVEALTSKELIRYLNIIPYEGEIENKIEGAPKNLFSRVLDLMMSLISNLNTNNNSMLTKVNDVFAKFAEEVLVESNESAESNESTDSNETVDTAPEEEITPDEAATDTQSPITTVAADDTSIADDYGIYNMDDADDILRAFSFESSIQESPMNSVPNINSIRQKFTNRNDRESFNKMLNDGQINISCH